MRDIVIIGASGFARETLAIIEDNNRARSNDPEWNVLGFVDNNTEVGTLINGYPVLGGDDWLIAYPKEICAVCAVGEANIRRRIIEKYRATPNHVCFPNIISRRATLTSRTTTMGEGCIICPGNVLTCNIKIGDFMISNMNNTFGHDAIIGDFVTINPGSNISGYVTLGKEITIGAGVQIIPHKSVGNGVIIGAGAVVIKDLPDNCTAVGAPAKPIKFHD